MLFIVLPITEVWLIVQVARATSWATTFLIVIATGIIGTAMARHQGWKIWGRIRGALGRGELPGDDLLDGFFLLVGGILLITPGLITDSVGFILLIPLTRALIRNYVKMRLKKSIRRGTTRFHFYTTGVASEYDSDIIDVTSEEEDE